MSRDRFLAAGVELFEETGEWPKIDWVQLALVGWRDDTNAGLEARRLPASLGGVKNGRVILGVRAFYKAEPSSRLLEAFRIGLREAWRRYRQGDPPADVLLSVSDLVNDANLSEAEAKQAIELLAVEGLVEKKTERVSRVVSAIRHYKTTQTIEEYLERKREFERKHCLRRFWNKSTDFLREAIRPEGWVGKLLLGALAILLAALALWIGKELFGSASLPSDERSIPRKSQSSANQEHKRVGPTPPARAGRR